MENIEKKTNFFNNFVLDLEQLSNYKILLRTNFFFIYKRGKNIIIEKINKPNDLKTLQLKN